MGVNRPRTIPLSPRMVQILEAQRAAFITKFGREPGPTDPVFFDPARDVPTPLTRAHFDAAARAAGLDPKQLRRGTQPTGMDNYREQRWRCEDCGRTGVVLIHRLDTTKRKQWRRATSHRAQVRRDRCAGSLVWTEGEDGR